MFCPTNRSKWARQVGQSSFDLVDMSQFRSTSFRIICSYMFMYVQLLITLAVYGSDIYTAIMLLAFDRWASSISPWVPFHISRWLFGGCIILSFLLLAYDYVQAYRVWKRNNICLTYTNPICRTIFSIKGYNYFCLFAKITKSKEFTDYVALFVFFTFKGWANLLLAEGPRQVLNALTLYSVLKVDDDFVGAVTALAEKSHVEAVVVSFMAFSLLIWVISMILFILAIFCSCSVWTQVKRNDCHSLEQYCCVRIDKRVAHLVAKYHKRGMKNLALENSRMSKQPTIPFMQLGGAMDDSSSVFYSKGGFNESSASVNSYSKGGYNDSSASVNSYNDSYKSNYTRSYGNPSHNSPYGLKPSTSPSKTNLLTADQVAEEYNLAKDSDSYYMSDLRPYDSVNTLAEPEMYSLKRSDTENSGLASSTTAGSGVYPVPRLPARTRQLTGGPGSQTGSSQVSGHGLYQNPDVANSAGSISTYLDTESQLFAPTYSPPRTDRRPSGPYDPERRPSGADRRPSGPFQTDRRPSGAERRPSGPYDTGRKPPGGSSAASFASERPSGAFETERRPSGPYETGRKPSGTSVASFGSERPTGSSETERRPSGPYDGGRKPSGTSETERRPSGPYDGGRKPSGTSVPERRPSGASRRNISPYGSQPPVQAPVQSQNPYQLPALSQRSPSPEHSQPHLPFQLDHTSSQPHDDPFNPYHRR